MEELIKQTFVGVYIIGPSVQKHHYDLLGPSGEIILPSVWAEVIQPGWEITMHMWPTDDLKGAISRAPGLEGHGTGPPGPRAGVPPHQYPPQTGLEESVPTPFRASETHTVAARGSHDLSCEVTKEKPRPIHKTSRHQFRPGRAMQSRPPAMSRPAMSRPFRGPFLALQGESEASSDESGGLQFSSAEGDAQNGAARRRLIIVRRTKSHHGSNSQRRFQAPLRRQTIRPLEEVVSPPWEMEIKSARVYREELALTGAASLELVGRIQGKPDPAADSGETGGGTRNQRGKHTTWL